MISFPVLLISCAFVGFLGFLLSAYAHGRLDYDDGHEDGYEEGFEDGLALHESQTRWRLTHAAPVENPAAPLVVIPQVLLTTHKN